VSVSVACVRRTGSGALRTELNGELMSFSAWYVSRGRITRRTWWLHYTLPLLGLSILASIADASFGYPAFTSSPEDGVYHYVGGPISSLLSLATLVPSLTSMVTRLHDRGYSAWWLLWMLLPFVGWIVLFVQCGFVVGQVGANRYGPAPDDVIRLLHEA
jgi:uncharacterized membrane protein YhaH (DUF805 family)